MALPEAFFLPDAGDWQPTELTRGPWSMQHQHGGPPTALAVSEVQRLHGGDGALRVARVTVEFLRPVPLERVRVRTEVLRPGRAALTVAVTLSCGGVDVLYALVLLARPTDATVPRVAHAVRSLPRPDESDPFVFPFFGDTVAYHRGVELRMARGVFGSGDAAAWLRAVRPLVAGRTTSPVAHLLLLADAANGVSAPLDTTRYTFVNPDLSVHLARTPDAGWIAIDGVTSVEPDGAGLVDGRLLDERGPVGRVNQSLVVRTRP